MVRAYANFDTPRQIWYHVTYGVLPQGKAPYPFSRGNTIKCIAEWRRLWCQKNLC